MGRDQKHGYQIVLGENCAEDWINLPHDIFAEVGTMDFDMDSVVASILFQ